MRNDSYCEVLLPVGGGIEGECFIIVDSSMNDGNPVVRKLCSSTHEENRKRFKKEHSNLKSLQPHDNVISLYSGIVTDGLEQYYAMELADGGCISDYVKSAKPDMENRIKLTIELFHALGHTHRKGITHRDLHFANALIKTHEDQPTLKLADFGFSRNDLEGSPSDDLWTLKMPYLTPPERLFNLEFKDRHMQYKQADIHAAGLHAYYLLTKLEPTSYVVALMSSVGSFLTAKRVTFYGGMLPIISDSTSPADRRSLYDEWLQNSTFDPKNHMTVDLPEKSAAANDMIREVIAKCVHPDIDKRYNDIEHARKELETC